LLLPATPIAAVVASAQVPQRSSAGDLRWAVLSSITGLADGDVAAGQNHEPRIKRRKQTDTANLSYNHTYVDRAGARSILIDVQ